MTVIDNPTPTETPEAVHNGKGRHPKAGIAFTVVALLFGLSGFFVIDPNRTTTFELDQTTLSTGTVNTMHIVLTAAGVAFLFGILFLIGLPSKLYKLAVVGGLLALVVGALSWVVTPAVEFPIEFVLLNTLFLALPFIFGALSGVVSERSGVINIGIEGQFLMGAFSAALVASITGNPYAGMIAAVVSGMLSTLLLAWLATRFQVNQVVTGVILNLLALGLTGFLYERLMRGDASLNRATTVPRIGESLENMGLGFLTDIPVVGPMLFNQSIFVYLALFAVVALWFLLFRTRWGLRTRSVGEHPAAADSVGIKVNSMRFWNVTVAGALSGFGGAFFTIANNVAFNKNMTAGLGFVALAVMIVGRWNPMGVLAGALVFGFSKAVEEYLNSMQDNPIPTEFLAMLPYAVTLVVVAGVIGKAVPPASNGVPYTPGDK
ncbi:ABC transporter permease [Haloglycomyces albus]|uniref:ABC transporter permease n=1 Tax=Haloglycomyces albus TaxID=526067 RepID=UPI00046CCDCC|nr:ABC transporter permease [Haloglycomyces albus]